MSAYPWDLRLSRLEGAYEQIDKRLGDLRQDIDQRFSDLRQDLASRFATHEVRFSRLEQKIDGMQWRLTALIVGTWVATIGAVLFHR